MKWFKILNNQNGFTLIEVLVAFMIMVGAILVINSSWSGSFLRIRKTQLNYNVAELLERKAAEVTILYQGKKLTEISNLSGDFGSGFPQYRWTFTTQPFEMPDMSSSLTSQGTGANQILLTVLNQMREAIGKAVLEGTITVYVRNKDREVPFSVTTYFVDYDTPIGLPGG